MNNPSNTIEICIWFTALHFSLQPNNKVKIRWRSLWRPSYYSALGRPRSLHAAVLPVSSTMRLPVFCSQQRTIANLLRLSHNCLREKSCCRKCKTYRRCRMDAARRPTARIAISPPITAAVIVVFRLPANGEIRIHFHWVWWWIKIKASYLEGNKERLVRRIHTMDDLAEASWTAAILLV